MKKFVWGCVSANKAEPGSMPRTIRERPQSEYMHKSRVAPPPPGSEPVAKDGQRRPSEPQEPPPQAAGRLRRGSDPERRRFESSAHANKRRASVDRQGTKETEIQIVLIGKTGNGKSSTGNAILARSTPQFEVSTGILSATEHTQLAESHRAFRGGNLMVQVVDFPDVTSDMTEEQARKEIERCTTLTYPYPSAVCLVVRADVRFTPEEYATYRKTRELLGERMFKNMVVVFTMADKLPAADRDNFHQQLERANTELKQVLQDAQQHYVLLGNGQDNDGVPNDHQGEHNDKNKGVAKLLDTVVDLHNTALQIKTSLLKTLRVAILGSPGSGKSATGNSLLFPNPQFEVCTGFATATSFDSASATMLGFQLEIVDTPGVSSKQARGNPGKLSRDVQNWFKLLDPGPDVLLFVTKANERFKDEDYDVFKALQRVIGDDFNKHVIVVFTGGDALTKDRRTIEKEIERAPESLRSLLTEAKNRFVVMDNNASSTTEKLLQRNRLLQEMTALQNTNKKQALKMTKKALAEGDEGTIGESSENSLTPHHGHQAGWRCAVS